MKSIYIDYNILLSLYENERLGLHERFDELHKQGYQILCSPAHIEEIAALVRRHGHKEEEAEKRLEFVRSSLKAKMLLPFYRDDAPQRDFHGIYLSDESPFATYSRVVKDYDQKNPIAEGIQRVKLKNAEKFRNTHEQAQSKYANNIEADKEIETHFSNDLHEGVVEQWSKWINILKVRDCMPDNPPEVAQINFDYLSKYFPLHEAAMELALEFLEVRGYFHESEEVALNALHDTTHVIYAAYCDFFISNDKKLRKKSEAVYIDQKSNN